MLRTGLSDRAATRLQSAWPWLVLAVWPVLLALSNAKWMFDPPWYDQYIYLGAFLRLPAQLHAWSDLYFYSRLAFLLPGYVAYSVLPPLVANICLHFGYFYASVGVLFVLLRRVTGVRGALFAALLMGGYNQFLTAVGWDYVDGVAALYLLVAVWAMTCAIASSRPWIWLVAAGLALGAGLHSQLFTLAFWPTVGLYLLLVWPSTERLWRLILAGLWVGAGIATLTVFLGLLSLALGGRFAFYMSTFNFAQQFASLSTNPWYPIPLVQLIPSAMWLMPPAVVALAALWRLGRQVRLDPGGWRSPAVIFSACYLAACGVMLLLTLRPATPVLSIPYYVSFLIPFMALTVGVLAAPALEQLAGPQYRIVLGLLAISVPAAILAGTWLSATLLPITQRSGGWLVLGGLLLAAALLAIRRAGFVSLLGAVLLFALVNPLGPSIDSTLLVSDAAARRETFLKVVDGVRTIDAAWPGQQVWLWFNYQEDEAYQLTACALAACDGNVISREFPAFHVAYTDKLSVPMLAPGRQVVLLSKQPNALDLVSSAAGYTVTAPVEQFSDTNSAGGPPFQMYFLHEPEQGWQITLPPAVWMVFQSFAAVAQADGSFFSDPKIVQPGFKAYMAYGPYINLPPGRYEVTFWLAAQPTALTGELAHLDVVTEQNAKDFFGSNQILQAHDFAKSSLAQPFSLTFATGSFGNVVEFRVLTLGKVPLTLSRVQLKWVSAYQSGSAVSR